MNKIILVSLLLVAGIILFVVGVVVGYMYYQPQGSSLIPTVVEKNIWPSSKVVSQITTTGKVTKIDGNDITLTNEGDTLKIRVIKNAIIYASKVSTQNGKNVTSVEKATFSDIKVGSDLNILTNVSSTDKQLEGYSVLIK